MCSKYYSKLCSILIYVLLLNTASAQKTFIPKPVFDDPIYHGAVGKTMYYADSKDLYTWQDKGKDKTIGRGEGPKVFKWQQQYFMIVDCWKGMDVYA
ncbi:MAG: hypothetical protein WCG74_04195 [Sediminibacterium sp.]